MSGPAQGRRFTDREATHILRRAVALQEKVGAGGRGLTLEELKGIAREVGVEPRYVEEAARTLGPRSASRGALARALGGATTFQFVETLSEPLQPTDVQRVIDEIRSAMGRHGRIAYVANAMEWQARDAMGGTFVTVSRVGEETRVRVIGVRNSAAVTTYAFATAGTIVLSLVVGQSLGPPGSATIIPGVLATIAAGYGVTRAAWSAISRKWETRLRRTLNGVVAALRGRHDAADPEPGDEIAP